MDRRKIKKIALKYYKSPIKGYLYIFTTYNIPEYTIYQYLGISYYGFTNKYNNKAFEKSFSNILTKENIKVKSILNS